MHYDYSLKLHLDFESRYDHASKLLVRVASRCAFQLALHVTEICVISDCRCCYYTLPLFNCL